MRLPLLLVFGVLIAARSAAPLPSDAASGAAMAVLPPSLADYTTWKRLTPDGYSIPPQLALLCTAPARAPFPKSVEVYGPHANTFVRVFANLLAARAINSRGVFPEGSILVKEKLHNAIPSAHGVMIKRAKGFNRSTGDWQFLFYPSERSASFTSCSDCHRSAPHDFVFGSYPG
jgi:Cytochrome P460